MRHLMGTCPLALGYRYAGSYSCIITGTIDRGSVGKTFEKIVFLTKEGGTSLFKNHVISIPHV